MHPTLFTTASTMFKFVVVISVLSVAFAGWADNGTEVIPANEPETIAAISALFRQSMANQYQAGTQWLRQAHAKQHACVRAFLTPDPSMPEEYARGVFGNFTSYPVMLRFSNGVGRGFSSTYCVHLALHDHAPVVVDSTNVSDHKLDTRGMGMKIFKVHKRACVSSHAT